MINALRLVCSLAFLAAALLPATAFPGDEDTKPAYMIYIDPETGRYTTEDPDTDRTNDPVAPERQASENSEPERPLLIVVGSVLAVLLVSGLLRHQRRQHLR